MDRIGDVKGIEVIKSGIYTTDIRLVIRDISGNRKKIVIFLGSGPTVVIFPKLIGSDTTFTIKKIRNNPKAE